MPTATCTVFGKHNGNYIYRGKEVHTGRGSKSIFVGRLGFWAISGAALQGADALLHCHHSLGWGAPCGPGTADRHSELMAYMHYVLVNPAYHGRGIAGNMIKMVKEKYRNYLYIEIMPEESKNASFYEKYGFQTMPDGVAMQLCNFTDKR